MIVSSVTPIYIRAVSRWLLVCLACVVMMVMVGGLTRLTNSGLSMVEWRPVTGWLLPLNQEAWQAEKEKYKTSPEYQKINHGMTLDEFKSIYYWEYGHRLLGRITGLMVGVPLLYFWARRALSLQFSLKLLGIFAVGGLQGAVGWIMVKSGLIDRPAVSHYKLAMHLSTALLIFALLFWQFLNVRIEPKLGQIKKNALKAHAAQPFAVAVLALVCVQIVWGAFVAGLDAGLVYNTYPLMDGDFFPQGGLALTPIWLNFLENIPSVQWFHRWWAMVTFAAIIGFFWRYRNDTALRKATRGLLAVVMLQVLLGILTLLHAVPVPLASLHQLVALVLFAKCVYILHRCGRR